MAGQDSDLKSYRLKSICLSSFLGICTHDKHGDFSIGWLWSLTNPLLWQNFLSANFREGILFLASKHSLFQDSINQLKLRHGEPKNAKCKAQNTKLQFKIQNFPSAHHGLF
jgi:hypothetical protein